MFEEKALSLSNKILQENFLERYDEYLTDKQSRPWVVELDPTTACKLNIVFKELEEFSKLDVEKKVIPVIKKIFGIKNVKIR